MDSAAGTLLVGVAAFAATSLDDLFLLVVYFAIGWGRARDVVLGQYAGIGALFAASALASLLSFIIPAGYLCLLGLVPVLIGLRQLRADHPSGPQTPPRSGIFPVAAATLANGGDNFGVYIPLFATSSALEIGLFGAVFAVMTGAWCLAAHWLVSHPAAGAPIRRHGPRVAPFVLIGIGLLILAC
ncbi:MAG: quaternary ammonium transporter [Betaproteobacteria bacterium]|nr:quaternary ammonium transporter [Betaproteobacteria bacterium]